MCVYTCIIFFINDHNLHKCTHPKHKQIYACTHTYTHYTWTHAHTLHIHTWTHALMHTTHTHTSYTHMHTQGHTASISAVARSLKDNHIVSGADNGQILLHATTSTQLLANLTKDHRDKDSSSKQVHMDLRVPSSMPLVHVLLHYNLLAFIFPLLSPPPPPFFSTHFFSLSGCHSTCLLSSRQSSHRIIG